MTTTPEDAAADHAAAQRHDAAGTLRDELLQRPTTEDRILAVTTANRVQHDTAEAKERDQAQPEPARTEHPTGAPQAATNRDNESPA